jgi:hypothetical protein
MTDEAITLPDAPTGATRRITGTLLKLTDTMAASFSPPTSRS